MSVDIGTELQKAYDEGYEDGKRDAASPWRRVEEPPEENGRYFVSWEGAVTTDEYKNGVWLYASMFNQRVTYWMPIPEPPKGDA
jgi:hypothetical protein